MATKNDEQKQVVDEDDDLSFASGEVTPSVLEFVNREVERVNKENPGLKLVESPTTPEMRTRIGKSLQQLMKSAVSADGPNFEDALTAETADRVKRANEAFLRDHPEYSFHSSGANLLVRIFAELASGDKSENRAIHHIANGRFGSALDAFDIDESVNNFEQTPRHLLALLGFHEALAHPNADAIYDRNGRSARDLFKLGLAQYLGTTKAED